jgi:hypothetical protein
MGLSVRSIVLSGCVLTAAVAVSAQGPPANPAGAQAPAAQGGQAPAAERNLKVLPQTWTNQQVSALMRTFTTSLDVQCGHCHTEDPDAPPPNPGQNPRLDYALDGKPEKEVARKMMQMVMNINGTGLAGIGDAAVPEKVSCFSCHRTEATPPSAPADGWGRGAFSLSEAGPVLPQRGRGAGPGAAPGGAPAAPPAGGAPGGRGN